MTKNPFKKAPAPKNSSMKNGISITTEIPREHEPATKVTNNIPHENVEFEPTKIFPVKMTNKIIWRLTIASATEGVKRWTPGKKGVSNTTIVNEAVIEWLNKHGY